MSGTPSPPNFVLALAGLELSEFTIYAQHQESAMYRPEQGGLGTFHEGFSIEQYISYLLSAITCLRVSVSQSRTAVAQMYYRWICSQIRDERSLTTSFTTCNLLILIVSTSYIRSLRLARTPSNVLVQSSTMISHVIICKSLAEPRLNSRAAAIRTCPSMPAPR